MAGQEAAAKFGEWARANTSKIRGDALGEAAIGFAAGYDAAEAMLAKALAEARLAYNVTSTMLDEVVVERDEAQGKLEAVEALANYWRTNGSLGDRELMGKMVLAIVKGESE